MEEDLYVAGSTVKIAGTIKGDLIVLATDHLEVSGRVEGDVIGFATTANIGGMVGGSVRLAGVDFGITAEVDGDVVGLGRDLRLGGSIAGDTLVWSRSLFAGGRVGHDMGRPHLRVHHHRRRGGAGRGDDRGEDAGARRRPHNRGPGLPQRQWSNHPSGGGHRRDRGPSPSPLPRPQAAGCRDDGSASSPSCCSSPTASSGSASAPGRWIDRSPSWKSVRCDHSCVA